MRAKPHDAGDAGAVGSLAFERLVVVFESCYASQQVLVRVWRHLHLYGFETYAEVLQFIIIFPKFLLPA